MSDGRDRIMEALAEAATVEPKRVDPKDAKPPRKRRKKAPEPQQRPRPTPGGGEWPIRGPIDPAAEALDLECALQPLTDLGNAQRFMVRHGDSFLFVREWGWLAWDGRRWARQGALGRLERAIQETIVAIADEADAFAHSGQDWLVEVKKGQKVYYSHKILGWGLSSQGASHIKCIPELLQPMLERTPDVFDSDPRAINVANGTLRFEQVPDDECPDPDVERLVWRPRLDPHRREDHLTRLAPVPYLPDAPALLWDEFLQRVQPSLPMRRHILDWGGLSLTGIMIQKLALWYGGGSNGKSTALEAFAAIAGDYGQLVPVETFLDQGPKKAGSTASPDLARLSGVRLLRTTEMEKEAKLAEGLIKTATGGEPLLVRLMYRDFFDLFPQFKLTLFGNHKPKIRGMDHGIWRRVLLVPWSIQIPDAEIDRTLPEKLKDEYPGILAQMIEGVCRFLERGLEVPQEVVDATAEYKVESDVLGRFQDDCLEVAAPELKARVPNGILYPLFRAWSVAMDGTEWTQKGFSAAMHARGFRSIKTGGVMVWLDILTKASKHDFLENPDTDDMSKWKPKRSVE